MTKVFTITEGLENMGALKTGGQGSVYKGRRIGEIITAIKILPTPIHSESAADKNFTSFQNEVMKLKKVNEHPNPNVVTILHSGITESGNFPFIEMEYIEGPDLAELLTPPHEPIFLIKEVIKVAEHLSNALAHCHSADVKHGDIKSNNVKFNTKTGNYVLLDFGLSVMSDEQRRTSFRHAGAIEFMAPEQNEGHMHFQTDVYSFGVIMYELLAGTVPFSLKDKGESARNMVMLAHMEQPPPDLVLLRKNALPPTWSNEKKEQEMQVPEWLITMTYICLQKKPKSRFDNGIQLNKFVQRNNIFIEHKNEWSEERIILLQQDNERLKKEKEELEKQLHQALLSAPVAGNNSFGAPTRTVKAPAHKNKTPAFIKAASIIITLIAVTVLIYIYIKDNNPQTPAEPEASTQSPKSTRLITLHKNEEAGSQLKYASDYLKNGEIEPALLIYKNLIKKDVPEAMYQYGNLALQNLNKTVGCNQAVAYLERAASKGYVPAKTTLGFLYSFAGDEDMLKQNGYDRCVLEKDIIKGSKFLMEAMLSGDSTASLLLDELNHVPTEQ